MARMNMGTKFRKAPRANLSPTAQAQMRALQSQKTRLDLPYHSSVRFNAARTGAGPFTFTLAAGDIEAFSYGVGKDASRAGFPVVGTFTPTDAETNLQEAYQTVGGQNVLVRGFRLIIEPDSDAKLASLMWSQTSCGMRFNNGELVTVPFGNLSMIPGGGSLFGTGQDQTGIQSMLGIRPKFDFFGNGMPLQGNYFKLSNPFTWKQGSSTDGQFSIIFKVQRAVVLTATDVAGVIDPATNATSVQAFTSPADGAVYVKLKVVLVGETISKRTKIA